MDRRGVNVDRRASACLASLMRASVSVLLTAQSPGTEAFEVVPAYALLQARRDRGWDRSSGTHRAAAGGLDPCVIAVSSAVRRLTIDEGRLAK